MNSSSIQVELTPAAAIRQGSKSFALAALFLPARCRARALILYQWCRNCDDAIDESPSIAEAQSRLMRLEDRDFSSPVLHGLGLTDPEWLDARQRAEFIAGMRMDVDGCRYNSLVELEVYCFRVAGVVGLMMCPLLGAHAEKAPPHAAALGNAMQLTNIARDVQADARMRRIYIPLNLLEEVEISPDLLATKPELAYPAVKVLLSRAEELYKYGFEGIKWLPWRVAFAIAVAGKVYQRIGRKLLRAAAKNPQSAFRRRTVVSIFGKAAAVAQAIFLVLRIKMFSRLLRPGIQQSQTTTTSLGYPG